MGRRFDLISASCGAPPFAMVEIHGTSFHCNVHVKNIQKGVRVCLFLIFSRKPRNLEALNSLTCIKHLNQYYLKLSIQEKINIYIKLERSKRVAPANIKLKIDKLVKIKH